MTLCIAWFASKRGSLTFLRARNKSSFIGPGHIKRFFPGHVCLNWLKMDAKSSTSLSLKATSAARDMPRKRKDNTKQNEDRSFVDFPRKIKAVWQLKYYPHQRLRVKDKLSGVAEVIHPRANSVWQKEKKRFSDFTRKHKRGKVFFLRVWRDNFLLLSFLFSEF